MIENSEVYCMLSISSYIKAHRSETDMHHIKVFTLLQVISNKSFNRAERGAYYNIIYDAN